MAKDLACPKRNNSVGKLEGLVADAREAFVRVIRTEQKRVHQGRESGNEKGISSRTKVNNQFRT